MKHLLVPLDGSPLAEHVLPYARLIAPALHGTVTLVQALDSHDHAAHTGEQPDETTQRHAEAYLAAQARTFPDDVPVATSTAYGPAPDVITGNGQPGETLIAMTTHGYTGVRRMVLGSVADQVVRTANNPVLIVRGDVAPPARVAIKRMLVPLDGSARAEKALPYAMELAQATGAMLVLLRVIEPPSLVYVDLIQLAPPTMNALLESTLQEITQHMAVLTHRLTRQYKRVQFSVVEGIPRESIVQEAVHRQADLIVMTTHGRGGLQRLALGSVADHVLHATPTPVVLVRVG